MTRPTRADLAGRQPASTRSRPAAANRPGGPRKDEERALARRADRRAGTRVADHQPLAASWDPQPGSSPRRRAVRRQHRGRLARALSTYGWRVYALPALVVLTVLAVLDTGDPLAPLSSDLGLESLSGSAQQTQPQDSLLAAPLIPNPIGGPGFDVAKASAELPVGGQFTAQGGKSWRVVPGAGPAFGGGQLFTYTVEVEDGVELEGGPEGFATTVDHTLSNPKSWIGSGQYQFQRIDDSRTADLRISLTSQLTTRTLCGFRIPFDASCWKGDQQRVVINNARWVRGAVAFQGNLVQYQQYVINHEVGHGLGFPHTPCPQTGQLAPVMMQQTWGVSNDYLAALGTDRVRVDGKVCEPNAWPFPTVN